MNYHSRKTSATIDLTALKYNYQQISALAKNSKTIAVIKADAYGHGAGTIAHTLEKEVPAFAVAFIDEAIALREQGITAPILILEGPMSARDINLAEQNNFWLMLHSSFQLDWLVPQCSANSSPLWLKVNTGMNRLGFHVEQIEDIISRLENSGHANLVLCTHFACADDIDNPMTLKQASRLQKIAALHQYEVSMANSAAIITKPQTHGDWNRLGIALYGANPLGHGSLSISLKPVMTLQSSVIAIRELNKDEAVGYNCCWHAERPSIIATIAIGYGDGYPRQAKTGTPVIINKQKAMLVGRVSMDMITVDITDLTEVKIGDRVELWGKQLSIETVAEYAGTINYELLTRISSRVVKYYINV